ncbi:DedA family protein [Spirillospora sp. NPDC127200]
MIDFIWPLLSRAGDHVALVLVAVFLFALVDAALGVGAFLPGETAVVLAAIALADDTVHIMLAVVAAAVGAFAGDHIGFLVGRMLGPRLGATRLVRRLGQDNWARAGDYVARRFWVVIVARLMPGIRTLVSAAAGASPIRYPRFAAICAVAAVLWATLWVVGGAIAGRTLLDVVDRYTVPSLLVAALAVAVAVAVRLWRARDMS